MIRIGSFVLLTRFVIVRIYASSKYGPLGPTNQIAGFFDQSDSRSQVT